MSYLYNTANRWSVLSKPEVVSCHAKLQCMFCTCSIKHVKNSYCFPYGPASFPLNLHDSHIGRTVLKRFFNSKSTDASESP